MVRRKYLPSSRLIPWETLRYYFQVVKRKYLPTSQLIVWETLRYPLRSKGSLLYWPGFISQHLCRVCSCPSFHRERERERQRERQRQRERNLQSVKPNHFFWFSHLIYKIYKKIIIYLLNIKIKS